MPASGMRLTYKSKSQHVSMLMKRMRMETLYRKPNTSKPEPDECSAILRGLHKGKAPAGLLALLLLLDARNRARTRQSPGEASQ